MRDDLINELRSRPVEDLASSWIMDRPTPFFFGNDHQSFARWKLLLASKLDVDPHSLLVVGSACLGHSLNPHKNWKAFDDGSDIDVAVVSSTHFDQAWFFLRHMGVERLRYPAHVTEAIEQHESLYVFWGAIATDKILGILPFGKNWLEALGDMSRIAPTNERAIKTRLYRDFNAVREYQITNLRKLRNTSLLAGEVTVPA